MHYRLLASLLLIAPCLATANPIEDAVEARHGYFTMLATNIGPLSAMLKGDLDYDEDAAAMHGKNIEVLSNYGLMMHFPEGSSTDELGDETEAKPKIWSDMDGFMQKFADFKEAATGAGEAVRGGKGNLAPVVQGLGKTCKSCHDEYRAK